MDYRYIFQGLLLAAPKDGDEHWANWHWCEPITYLGAHSIQAADQTSEVVIDGLNETIHELDEMFQLDDGEAGEDEEDDTDEAGRPG